MKKRRAEQSIAASNHVSEDDILPEYDFSKGRRNPYAARFAGGTTVVVLDDDVAESFPDAASVNDALRALMRIAEKRQNRAPKRIAR